MSSFIIYNQARERIGLLQNEESIQWLEHYQKAGEVKIVAQSTTENIELLQEGNRIYNTESDTVAVICHVQISEEESGVSLVVRAFLTAELLSRRVVMATEYVTNFEAAMYSIYQKNRRELPIEIGGAEGYEERTTMEITWNSVLEAEEKLAENAGLGFKVQFDPETAIETFKVYKGIDRSDFESDMYTGYFGTDVGNIQRVSIESGSSEYKNVAVVAGAGEGDLRAIRTVSLGGVSGEARRELYVDARDLQKDYQVATPTGEYDSSGNPLYSYESKSYTDAEYAAILDTRGYEKLAEHLRDFEIMCDVTQTNIAFGKDYFLGDRMPVKLNEYGIMASALISSVNRIYEREGIRLEITMSNFKLL